MRYTKDKLILEIESWVKEFVGMKQGENHVSIKYQPLYSSIFTTALNGNEVILLGINPGMERDYEKGILDWNAHFPFYKKGMFDENSHYHSYLDYHPRGRVVRGFENLLAKSLLSYTSIKYYPNEDWLRSIPTGNLFPRATNKADELGKPGFELSSIELLRLLQSKVIVLMGSDNARLAWLTSERIACGVQAVRLPFPDARGRGIIIRSSKSSWGGKLIAVPHPNSLSGTVLQLQVGAWIHENWLSL